MQAVFDEFPVFPLESDTTDMATQPERIASLETAASIAKWVLGIFIPLVIIWGAYITVSVISMKQSIADGGNAKLVAALRAPNSPAQLRASLSSVTAAVQTAQANGNKPDQKKTEALSRAVLGVVKKEPQFPEAWQAAAALISYRSPQSLPLLSDCFQVGHGSFLRNEINGERLPDTLRYQDCVLDLGRVGDFESSQSGRDWGEAAKGSATGLILEWTNVRLIYHGGPTIPFARIECFDCSFDFQIYTVPPIQARDLTQALLGVDDLKKISVNATQGG